jgi:hypothetical protein
VEEKARAAEASVVELHKKKLAEVQYHDLTISSDRAAESALAIEKAEKRADAAALALAEARADADAAADAAADALAAVVAAADVRVAEAVPAALALAAARADAATAVAVDVRVAEALAASRGFEEFYEEEEDLEENRSEAERDIAYTESSEWEGGVALREIDEASEREFRAAEKKWAARLEEERGKRKEAEEKAEELQKRLENMPDPASIINGLVEKRPGTLVIGPRGFNMVEASSRRNTGGRSGK